MIRVPPHGIVAGKRLPYDIVDALGRVMLLRGKAIASAEEACLLRETGFRRARPSKFASTYVGMSNHSDTLATIERDFVEHRDRDTLAHRIAILAKDLIGTADYDPDAAFANIHLEIMHPYSVVHQLMAALVCSRLAFVWGMDRVERIALVSAAITHDIGLLQVRKGFDAAPELSAMQRGEILRHPADGVDFLKILGVNDSLWLDAVRDHHEFLDGSGYLGKKRDELSLPARILSLADSFSAMLRPRPYRERVFADTALEALYVDESGRYDRSLLEILIWDLGFHPPGSLLRLANREIAVVIRNSPGILDSPRVASLTDPNGRPLAKPFPRDTHNPAFAIVETLDPSMASRSLNQIGQCWDS